MTQTKMNVVELMKKSSKEIMFEFDKDKKIGHMRCQYGWENQKANQFVKAENFTEKKEQYNIDLHKIQEVVNVIQFDWIKNYEIIEDLCNGQETNYFLQNENINYWIRLNPFGVHEYNLYIHMYHQ